MTYLISYDIINDKLRNNIAKVLKRNSCQRLQKSVFIAPHYDAKKLHKTKFQLEKLITEPLQTEESIIVIPIEADNINQIVWAGNAETLKNIVKVNLFKFF